MPVIVTSLVVLTIWWLSTPNLSSDAVSAVIGVIIGGAITGTIQYLISSGDRAHELRMAALDRRLLAHQQAYSLWIKLRFAGDKIGDVVIACQDWWDENCLFLTPQARKAFKKAFMSALDHAEFVRAHADLALVKAANADVLAAGEIIVRGVALPPIGDELDRIDSREN